MKKIALLFLLTLFIKGFVFSQTCLPDGIVFLSQEAIDNFQTNYPDCIEIEGDVSIGTGYETDINNLDGLDVLEKIDGYLEINENDNLTNLSGLDNLKSIGGYLRIEYNESLTELSGLDALETIGGGLFLYENHVLTDLSGLDALESIGGELEIGYHEALSSLTGLESVTTTGGMDMAYVHNITDFTGLSSLTSVEGNFVINDCKGIETLSGLNSLTSVNGNFLLNTLIALHSLTGLDALNNVNGKMSILGPPLDDLSNLSNLNSIGGGLEIKGCDTLSNLAGLENLTSIGGELIIGGNQTLESLRGIENIGYQTITNLKITYNPLLSECEVKSVCDYLADPGGIIWLHNNNSGCSSQTEVEEACNASSVFETVTDVRFHLYPNPANKEIFITKNNKSYSGELKIYDQVGRIVLHEKHVKGAVDVSSILKGIYIIELGSDDLIVRKKLILK